METNRFFIWVSRVNSLFFLLLLVLAIALLAFTFVQSFLWNAPRAVEVVKNEKDSESGLQEEKLTLGNIETLCGHDVKYIELMSKRSGNIYSSGGSGGQIRNVIFFTGKNKYAHWLFESNRYLINTIRSIPYRYSDCTKEKVVALYYDVVMNDSNHDGMLSDEDEHTIAISDPYGQNYRELVTGATKVLDYEITAEGQQISLLLQLDKQIIMRDYALTGDLVTESQVTDLSGR